MIYLYPRGGWEFVTGELEPGSVQDEISILTSAAEGLFRRSHDCACQVTRINSKELKEILKISKTSSISSSFPKNLIQTFLHWNQKIIADETESPH